MAQVPLTKPETLEADITAGAAYLRTADGGQVKSLYSVGFCFGGALSYLQAASGLGYAGVIGFYGWPSGLKRWPDRPKPIDAVPRYKCAVQSIFGGADKGIPQADVDAFDGACRKANVRHDLKVYPGAPHSFFDRKYTEFAEASADAWKRVQAFVNGKPGEALAKSRPPTLGPGSAPRYSPAPSGSPPDAGRAAVTARSWSARRRA
jgi:carboxymethylenebutenolidase